MKRKFAGIITIILFYSLASGAKGNFEVQKNQKINTKVKTEITLLNEKVYKLLGQSDYKTLKTLFSDSLLKYVPQEFETKFMPQLSGVIKGKEHRILDEFYIKNQQLDSPVTVEGGEGDQAYTFQLMTSQKETFVTLMAAGDTNNEVMITLVYTNINNNWKLSILRGEDYSLFGQNAVDIFHHAHMLRETGDIVDAYNFMNVASHYLNPGGSFFKYNLFDHISEYQDTLNFENNANFAMPYKVEQLKTKPEIFNIHLELLDGRLTPMIVYLSKIYVKDTMALKAENEEFNAKIGTIFTSMDKNNKAIIYRAYNEKPSGQNSPKYYGFVKRRDQK